MVLKRASASSPAPRKNTENNTTATTCIQRVAVSNRPPVASRTFAFTVCISISRSCRLRQTHIGRGCVRRDRFSDFDRSFIRNQGQTDPAYYDYPPCPQPPHH